MEPNTNKITLILIYDVLEWILILFLNSFFSYLLCETHIAEISKLGCYSNDRKLVELQDMCEDCSSSSQLDYCELLKIAFIPWVKQIGMIQGDDEKILENGEVNLRCFYCDVKLNSKFYYLYLLIKPS